MPTNSPEAVCSGSWLCGWCVQGKFLVRAVSKVSIQMQWGERAMILEIVFSQSFVGKRSNVCEQPLGHTESCSSQRLPSWDPFRIPLCLLPKWPSYYPIAQSCRSPNFPPAGKLGIERTSVSSTLAVWAGSPSRERPSGCGWSTAKRTVLLCWPWLWSGLGFCVAVWTSGRDSLRLIFYQNQWPSDIITHVKWGLRWSLSSRLYIKHEGNLQVGTYRVII